MNTTQFLDRVRRLVGNPPLEAVADRQFKPWVEDALTWMAQKLGYSLREDEISFELAAGENSYDLGPEIAQVRWIHWNGVRLTPSTTWEWDRSTPDYRTITPGIFSEYAIEGRQLLLNRPPGASEIASDPRLTVKAQLAGYGLSEGNIPDLPDADVRLAATYAAYRWLVANPDEKQMNQRRALGLQTLLEDDLREARARAGQTVADLQPRLSVVVAREGAAR